MDDPLAYLQEWYRDHCDGDWEHQFGVEIGTLDNPGWRLGVDLVGTELEGALMERHIVERSDDDWCHVWSDGARFEGACGAGNLGEAIDAFRSFAGRPNPGAGH